MTRPRLSVVVAVYNMRREAPRTLQTLTAAYQDVPRDAYELIVVENGSSDPLVRRRLQRSTPVFSTAGASPAIPPPQRRSMPQSARAVVRRWRF